MRKILLCLVAVFGLGLGTAVATEAPASASVNGMAWYTCASAQYKITWHETSNTKDTYVYDSSNHLMMYGYGAAYWYGFSTTPPRLLLENDDPVGTNPVYKYFLTYSSGFDGSC